MSKLYKIFAFLLLFSATAVSAQNYTLSGTVTSAETGETLIGANVYVKGTTIGAATNENGVYKINLDEGEYTVVCSYVGYEKQEVDINLTNNMELNFDLADYQFSLNVTVLADRAKERETPVAFTNVEKKALEKKLASREIPMVLNTTPSVYATQQGGGAGDARVNVRGFNQRNVAIMLNGVPVNDMENGWVYWSNWDGIGDVTSSIQIQRGLSVNTLTTPSIGGTMNIITDPTAQNLGAMFKQEFGNDAFMKSSLFANSGLVDGKWAVNAGGVRKISDGQIDKTWTDAWAYYFGASYNVNDNNRIELYAIGAPQRHGQNLYRQNIAVYDKDFAKSLDSYDEAAFDKYQEAGREFNQNWSPVTSNYNGDQYWDGDTHERYDQSFINERENFYHKPQINLNWYSKLTDKLSLYTTAYYSGGVGGGTGTYGEIYTRDFDGNLGDDDYKYYYGAAPWYRDWDRTIQMNQGPAGTYYVDKDELTKEKGQSLGILRNSVNNQWTIGAISKAYYKLSENFKLTAGLDWRTAEIEHYREVRDLLGGEYYIDYSSDFWGDAGKKRVLGDKIDYFNTNKVNWLGGFAQAEFTHNLWTFYGTFGMSTIKYKFTDHFRSDNGSERVVESDNIAGYQVKGGASYRLTEETLVYANAGYVSKVPIFDNVIDDRTGALNEDPDNEKYISLEGGINYRSNDGQWAAKLSYYYTNWEDRAITVGVQNQQFQDALVNISGLSQLHRGFEAEVAYQPIRYARLDVATSLGVWRYTENVDAKYKDYNNDGADNRSYKLYIDDLRVGDAPQTQFTAGLSVFPVEGLSAQVVYRYYRDFYADFSPLSRTDMNDTKQSWKAPSYGLLDLHINYDLPMKVSGVGFTLFAHVFNLTDEIYVQDATDNSPYNSWDQDHDADDAEVFLGLPRSFNVGISIQY